MLPDIVGLAVAKDVWMAPLHLVADRIGNIVETEQAVVGRDLAMKDDLEQQIAKLVANLGRIAAGNGIGDLIGFFDRVRRDGREILRQIPFATAIGIAQLAHDGEQAVDGGLGCRLGHRVIR